MDKPLNEYMSRRLKGCDQCDLCEDVVSDAHRASEFGVNSDRDYVLYFRLNHLTDELVQDTFDLKLPKDELCKLCKHLYSFKDDSNYDLTNLLDHRILVYRWLSTRSLDKQAHPNIGGWFTAPDKIDLKKWVATAKQIYDDVNRLQQTRTSAFKSRTKGWDQDEAVNFDHWLRYYDEHTTEKYNVKIANITKVAFGPSSLLFPEEWTKPENRTNQPAYADTKSKKEQEQDRARAFKAKMKSRMRALKMLLDKYNDALPHQNVEHLYDELTALEKSITKLNVYAALQDRVVRSAGCMSKYGFEQGATLLKQAADGLDLSAAAGETNLAPGQMKNDVEEVIKKLEGISKELKMRTLIREIAKSDIMLSEIGLASYFPEIAESLARLIEGYSYASNRMEDAISKLRGSGKKPQAEVKRETAPLPTAPVATQPGKVQLKPTEKLETGELMDKPVETAQPKLPGKV